MAVFVIRTPALIILGIIPTLMRQLPMIRTYNRFDDDNRNNQNCNNSNNYKDNKKKITSSTATATTTTTTSIS